MHALKLVRLIGAMTVVASAPALMAIAAHAQAPSAPPPAAEGQPSTRPELPGRPAMPGGQPPAMDQKPATGAAPVAPGRTPAAPDTQARDAKKDPMIGLAVFGADGQKVGEVLNVKAGSDGKVEEIHIKTGGLLGFGGKTVAIPAGKFNKAGQNVQLALTSDDVSKLPRLDDKPS